MVPSGVLPSIARWLTASSRSGSCIPITHPSPLRCSCPIRGQVMHWKREMDYSSPAFDQTRRQLAASLPHLFQSPTIMHKEPDPASDGEDFELIEASHDLTIDAGLIRPGVCRPDQLVPRPMAALRDSPELHELAQELAALKQRLVRSFRVYLHPEAAGGWLKQAVEL
jgi:hypothetical protein